MLFTPDSVRSIAIDHCVKMPLEKYDYLTSDTHQHGQLYNSL